MEKEETEEIKDVPEKVRGEISENQLLDDVAAVAEVANNERELPKGNDVEKQLLSKKKVDTKSKEPKNVFFEDVKDNEENIENKESVKGEEPKLYKSGAKAGQHKKSCNCNECKLKRGEKVEEVKKEPENEKGKSKDNSEGEKKSKIDPIAHCFNAIIALITVKLFKGKNPVDTIITFEQQQFLLEFQPEIKDVRSWWYYFPALILTSVTNFLVGNKATSFNYEQK